MRNFTSNKYSQEPPGLIVFESTEARLRELLEPLELLDDGRSCGAWRKWLAYGGAPDRVLGA